MRNKKEKTENSRRKFIQQGMALGASAVAGSFLLSSCNKKDEKSGEKVNVLSPDGHVLEIDKESIHNCRPAAADRKEARKGIPGRKFVMVIDLAKCKNARKCVEDCQDMHHLPLHMEYMKVYLMKDAKNTPPYWMPKPCFHCDNPPCVSLCPVGATYKRSDGIVLIDTHKCIGCKFCMTACPYSARVFNWEKEEQDEQDKEIAYSPETSIPRVHGTVSKCDFCPEMARAGKLPSCVTACPNGVIYYGDANEDAVSNGEEIVRLSSLLVDKGGYHYAEELGTEPSVYYLPPVDRIFPVDKGLDNMSEEIRNRYRNFAKEV